MNPKPNVEKRKMSNPGMIFKIFSTIGSSRLCMVKCMHKKAYITSIVLFLDQRNEEQLYLTAGQSL